MFGFLKKMFGGDKAQAPIDREGVLSISPDDLDSTDRLGPKLAAYARMQRHIADATYDPEIEAVLVGFSDGTNATVFLVNKIAAMRQMQTGEQVAAYLESAFAPIDTQSKGRLFPVLKPAYYVENARQQMRELGLSDDEPLPFWHVEIAPGLVLVLVVDSPESMRSISAAELEAQWPHPNDALRQARAEFIDYLNEREFGVMSMYDDKLHQWKLDDNYEASLFFTPELWDQQAEEFGAPPAAIFAARNIVVFADSSDATAMKLLKAVAETEGEEPAYSILPQQIWLYQDGQWTPYEDQPERPAVLN